MKPREPDLSQERLRELLHYEPETGVFHWRVNRSPKVRAGDIAGAITDKGYVVITVDYVNYLAHILAWLYVTGEWPSLIDHKDRRGSNNSFDNLRLATQSQNRANSCSRKDRKLDLPKGVTFCRQSQKYRAQVYLNGKRRFVAHFDNVESAAAAYIAEAKRLFGEFARAA